MRQNKTMLFALTGTLVVFLFVALFLFFSYRSENTTPIILPSPTVTGNPNPGPNDPGNATLLQVTEDNVQTVISTLKRPESFSQDILVETAWSDGKAKYEVSTWSKLGAARASIKSPNSKYKKEVILTRDSLYVWYEGEARYYTGKRGGEVVIDDFQMLPTYEDVLKIDKAKILEAGFTQKSNEPCIFVRAHTGELGYTDIYYISVITGLLFAAETFDGEELIYSMTVQNISLNTPPDDKFILPDGKSVIS